MGLTLEFVRDWEFISRIVADTAPGVLALGASRSIHD
jgi:hypothetical protein